jgi:hypothetical protein
MTARYELNENGSVTVFFETVADFTSFPDGTPWADTAEAEAWAQQFVAAKNDETLPMPPATRGGQSVPQITRAQKINAQQFITAIAVATTDEEKEAAHNAFQSFMASITNN